MQRGIALNGRGIPIDRTALHLRCLVALPENCGIPGSILITRDWLAGNLGTETGSGFSEGMGESCGDVMVARKPSI